FGLGRLTRPFDAHDVVGGDLDRLFLGRFHLDGDLGAAHAGDFARERLLAPAIDRLIGGNRPPGNGRHEENKPDRFEMISQHELFQSFLQTSAYWNAPRNSASFRSETIACGDTSL